MLISNVVKADDVLDVLHQDLYPPVLDSPKRKVLKKYVVAVFFWLVCVVIFTYIFSTTSVNFLSVLALWFGFMIGFIINTFLHELGHFFAGLCRGHRLLCFYVNAWYCRLTVQGFRWRKGRKIVGVLGAVSMQPKVKKSERAWRKDMVLFMLGGIGANFLVAGIMFVLYIYTPKSFVWMSICLVLGGAAFFQALLNLTPFSSKGWASDGLQCWHLLHEKENSISYRLACIAVLTFDGVSPKKWPQNLIPSQEEISDETIPFFKKYKMRLVIFYHALDVEDMSVALTYAKWFASHFFKIPDGLRQQVAAVMASFAAEKLQDKALLKAWIPLCEGALMDLSPLISLLQAEYAILEGDKDKACIAIQKARSECCDLMTLHDQEKLNARLNVLEGCLNLPSLY